MSDSGESNLYRVLFKNGTNNRVKVYFYYNSDILCWVSNTSKFIEPQQSYYNEDSGKFKYRVESDEIVSDVQVSQDASRVYIHGDGNFTTDDFNEAEFTKMSDGVESNLNRILFKNETNTRVKVYFYYIWDYICRASNTSKFIEPQQSYYKENSWKFKYRVESDEILSDVQVSKDASIVDIRRYGNFKTDDFNKADYESLRKDTLDLYRFKEKHKWGENDHEHLDLYKVLGLDIKEIRKLDRDEGTTKIKEAFFEKIKKFHRDKQLQRGGGDEIDYDAITVEIIKAYGILRDPIQRAAYNNHVLFTGKKGWRNKINPFLWPEMFKNFFTSIFWPDVGSEDEEKQRKWKLAKRLVYLATSIGLFAGGICVIALTSGLVLIPVGFAMVSGGISGGVRAALKQKCDLADYVIATGFGALAGAATGGACAGAISGIAAGGIGTATMAQQAAIGAATGVVGGFTNSVATDIEQIVCDGKVISLKQFVGHAIVGTLSGAAVGAVGGTIAGKLNASVTQVADEAVEQVAIAGTRNIARQLGNKCLQTLAEESIETVINSTSQFIEERANKDIENRSSLDHLSAGVASFGKYAGIKFGAAAARASAAKTKIFPSAMDPGPERVQPKGMRALDDDTLPHMKNNEAHQCFETAEREARMLIL